MFKTAIATAILGLGIAEAYFVIQTSNPIQKTDLGPGNNPVPANPFVEKVGDSSATIGISGENLTDKLLAKMGDGIKQVNSTISTSAGGKKMITVPNADTLTDELLGSAIDSFDPNSLYPKIFDSDLIVVKVSDKSSLTLYVSYLNKILAQENNLPTQKEINSEEDFLKNISTGLPIYEKIYSDLKKLPVPEKLLTYHKKEMELMGAKINILKSLSNIGADPMTAIIAATYAGQIETDLGNNYQMIKSLSK